MIVTLSTIAPTGSIQTVYLKRQLYYGGHSMFMIMNSPCGIETRTEILRAARNYSTCGPDKRTAPRGASIVQFSGQ